MIDVEQCALGTFEQDVLAALDFFAEHTRRILNVRSQRFSVGQILRRQRIDIRHGPAKLRKDRPGFFQLVRNPLAETRRRQQIAHSHAASRHLGLVRWTDASSRGAERAFALLSQSVEQLVRRQNDVRSLANDEITIVAEKASAAQLFHLFEQRLRIDHHSVAEYAALAASA